MKHFCLTLLLASLPLHLSATENWPQWRGPNDNCVAVAGQYPTTFSAADASNFVWKLALPGRGSSTPAVWGEQIFVTCPIEAQDGVLCYNFQGQELWRQQFGTERPGKHRNGSGSNPSPVTDGKHVVVYFKSGNLACLDLQGKKRWQVNLQEKYGKDTLWWDLGTSPVLASNKVVIAVMQDGDSFLVALNLADGSVAWKQERMFECGRESDQAYTTPHVLQLDGKEVIVTWGADHLTGHDASDGKLLWTCGGFNPERKGMWRVIASAAVDAEMAIVPYGRGQFVCGVDLRGVAGDITSSHRIWEQAGFAADVPSPILAGQQVILLTDKGKVNCLDKKTGAELWSGRLPKSKDKYYASPVLAGRTLYCTREDGVIMTAKIDNGLTEIKENEMGESVVATPIPLRGQLLVRGEQHLFLIGK